MQFKFFPFLPFSAFGSHPAVVRGLIGMREFKPELVGCKTETLLAILLYTIICPASTLFFYLKSLQIFLKQEATARIQLEITHLLESGHLPCSQPGSQSLAPHPVLYALSGVIP